MDYPLLSFQQTKNIRRVTFFGTGTAVDIRGQGFGDITGVIINGVQSPLFVVVSSSRILADIPTSELGVVIRSVSVLTSNITDTTASIVSFEASISSQQLGDAGVLVQRFLKILLTTPGSDIFSPDGGGLLSLIGQISQSDAASVEASAALYIQQAEETMMTSQAANPHLEDSAKLGKVTVLEASYSQAETALDIRLQIETLDGTVAVAGLAL